MSIQIDIHFSGLNIGKSRKKIKLWNFERVKTKTCFLLIPISIAHYNNCIQLHFPSRKLFQMICKKIRFWEVHLAFNVHRRSGQARNFSMHSFGIEQRFDRKNRKSENAVFTPVYTKFHMSVDYIYFKKIDKKWRKKTHMKFNVTSKNLVLLVFTWRLLVVSHSSVLNVLNANRIAEKDRFSMKKSRKSETVLGPVRFSDVDFPQNDSNNFQWNRYNLYNASAQSPYQSVIFSFRFTLNGKQRNPIAQL